MSYLLLFFADSCGENDESCTVIPDGENRVVVGFWETGDCSGEPVKTNSFPIDQKCKLLLLAWSFW